MNVIQVIIILGAQCVSPIDLAHNTTIAYQVPCATIVRTVEPPVAVVKKRSYRPCGSKRQVWNKSHTRYRCKR